MISSSRRRPAFYLFSVLLAGVATVGCGGSKTASLTGTVKYKGQLLPSGTITFLSEAGEKQVVATDIKDGTYTVAKIAAGPVQVTVTTSPPAKGGVPPGGGKPIEMPGASATPAGKYVPLPPRYAAPETSKLGFELKGGTQTKDFELTP